MIFQWAAVKAFLDFERSLRSLEAILAQDLDPGAILAMAQEGWEAPGALVDRLYDEAVLDPDGTRRRLGLE